MITLFDKNNEAKEIVEKADINKVIVKNNVYYINLHEAIVNLGINGGVFLIYAWNSAKEVSTVIAYWNRSYHSKNEPNIIFESNLGLEYTENNGTGTIAFNKTVNTIYAVPLIITS